MIINRKMFHTRMENNVHVSEHPLAFDHFNNLSFGAAFVLI